MTDVTVRWLGAGSRHGRCASSSGPRARAAGLYRSLGGEALEVVQFELRYPES
ncbi:MAG TPA: hypothetical protein VLV46_09255 [Gaiellaceae bacterium]|nr:hypothetical protein [Gaiellaceae bacterium]